MGQYHIIINKTKKERLNAHALDNGHKLREQTGWDGSTSTILMCLLSNSNGRGGGDFRGEHVNEHSGRWAGDAIVVQGDYAEEGDPAYISEAELETYTDISAELVGLQRELAGESSQKMCPDMLVVANR